MPGGHRWLRRRRRRLVRVVTMGYSHPNPTTTPSHGQASTRRLDLLIGRAVVSDTFRAGLLNNQRATLLREWQVAPEDAAKVMAIRAETFETFAQGVCRILGEGGVDAN